MSCVFCNIIAGAEPASILYEDDLVLAFPTIRAHAHLIVLPMHHPTDVTSARHARHMDDGRLVFSLDGVQEVSRADLDAMASLLLLEGQD